MNDFEPSLNNLNKSSKLLRRFIDFWLTTIKKEFFPPGLYDERIGYYGLLNLTHVYDCFKQCGWLPICALGTYNAWTASLIFWLMLKFNVCAAKNIVTYVGSKPFAENCTCTVIQLDHRGHNILHRSYGVWMTAAGCLLTP